MNNETATAKAARLADEKARLTPTMADIVAATERAYAKRYALTSPGYLVSVSLTRVCDELRYNQGTYAHYAVREAMATGVVEAVSALDEPCGFLSWIPVGAARRKA